MLAVLVKGGVACSKSDNVTGKRGECVSAVLVNSNNEDLSICYVREIISGIVNTLVVVGCCINLFSREELTVSGSADKNEVTVLELGGKEPFCCGIYIFSATMTLAVYEGVAECLSLICGVGVAASTGVGGVACLGTGGSGNYSLVGVAECLSLICGVGVATCTGVGGKACLSTSGSGNYSLIRVYVRIVVGILCATCALALCKGVSKCFYYICSVVFAALTKVSSVTCIGASRSGNYSLVSVAECLALGCAALTGLGCSTCCIAESVHMIIAAGKLIKKVLKSGNLACYVFYSITRSKAEEKYAEHKYKQHDKSDVFHFATFLSFLFVNYKPRIL